MHCFYKAFFVATCWGMAFFLGGCSTVPDADAPCLEASLIGSLSKLPLSSFMPEGTRKEERYVTVSGFKSGCGSALPGIAGEEGDVGISLILSVPRAKNRNGGGAGVGRGGAEGQAPPLKVIMLPLFVALLDDKDNVIDRKDFKIKFPLGNKALNCPYKLVYHPPKGISVKSKSHRILVGFHLRGKNVRPIKAKENPVSKKPSLKKKLKTKRRKA